MPLQSQPVCHSVSSIAEFAAAVESRLTLCALAEDESSNDEEPFCSVYIICAEHISDSQWLRPYVASGIHNRLIEGLPPTQCNKPKSVDMPRFHA